VGSPRMFIHNIRSCRPHLQAISMLYRQKTHLTWTGNVWNKLREPVPLRSVVFPSEIKDLALDAPGEGALEP
jgi:hypothetical protein